MNIDAELIREGGGLKWCICCTLRDDLLQEIERLALEKRFDYILIESTGVGEPLPVAQTFIYVDEEKQIDLSKLSRLDTMVTVVDAYHFWQDFNTRESLRDRGQEAGEDDTRNVVNLLKEQFEFSDVLIINKCDMVTEDELEKLELALKGLHPRVHIIWTSHGQIDPKAVLNTHLYNFEETSQSAA